MYTAMFGSRSFILENQTAYEVMKYAAQLLDSGARDAAREALRVAVRVENGTVAHGEVQELLEMRRAA